MVGLSKDGNELPSSLNTNTYISNLDNLSRISFDFIIFLFLTMNFIRLFKPSGEFR